MITTAEQENFEPIGIRGFFCGSGLPVFLITAVALYEIFLLAVVFAPAGSGPWSAFALEFKVWCFRYDTRTGGMAWTAFVVMLAEPLFIAGTTAFLWRRALMSVLQPGQWLRVRAAAGAGVITTALIAVGLFVYGRAATRTEPTLPFPGERIRVSITPPVFRFVDQKGAALSLDDLRGRIVLLTGVYAACSTSCPETLRDVKRALDALPENVRTRVSVVAISLNPEYETSDLMDRLAEGYGFAYPQFHYLNGDPAAVLEALQQLGFSRAKNVQTGIIEHANLALLIDPQGKIAYRLSLSPEHKSWIRDALFALAEEKSR